MESKIVDLTTQEKQSDYRDEGDQTNLSGGNLVDRPGEKPTRLRAEMRVDGNITVFMDQLPETDRSGNTLSYNETQFRLTDAHGKNVSIASFELRDAEEALLTPATAIDCRRVYYLEHPTLKLRTLCRRDGWMRELHSSKTLGAEISENGRSTSFRLFAPRAGALRLYLYDQADDQKESQIIEMTRDQDGVWEAIVDADLHGVYYDFTVHAIGNEQASVSVDKPDPGDYFFETHRVHITDPYARVSVDSFGKARVWKRTTPATPLKNGRPPMQDVVAYEVHVEDFTNDLPIEEGLKGTFSAMVKPGLKNERGESIGFDYLRNLGINVVHFLPVQEYLHYPDDVWQSAFADDHSMTRAGVNKTNYQWGYRTTHAFALETRYREANSEHGAQRDQFRDMVQAFHDAEIAVIVDLVPNHTGENMDARHYLFNFNAIDLPYYYRTDEQVRHIGPFGNEIKTEDRPMVRRWLIDQCKSLIDEFGIDGFRIDLAGQIDKPSLIQLREELGPDVIIYGEPWIAPSDPDVASNPKWSWYKSDAPITFFQDSARNAFKGPPNDPVNKKTDRGYAGGNASERSNAQLAITNGFEDEADPNRGINYLDIHDNWALADRFALSHWDGRPIQDGGGGVDTWRYKLAAGLLLTSLGPVVIHGGTEMMRSKGAAPNEHTIKYLPDGPLVYHGKKDSYNLRNANLFRWDNVGRQIQTPEESLDFAEMVEYWKGLIALRKSEAGGVLRVGVKPVDGYVEWILPADPHYLGYTIANRIKVLVNTADIDHTFEDIPFSEGRWRQVADEQIVNIHSKSASFEQVNTGNRKRDVRVPHASLKIFVRDER